jgi:hypothetical protein
MKSQIAKQNFKFREERERKFINWFINSSNDHKIDEITPIASGGRYDFIFFSANTHIIGEVKVREIEWNQYPTAIINQSKIFGILQQEAQTIKTFNSKVLYFAAYPKNRKILVFDVLNTPSTITIEWVKETTCDPSSTEGFAPMMNFPIGSAILTIDY